MTKVTPVLRAINPSWKRSDPDILLPGWEATVRDILGQASGISNESWRPAANRGLPNLGELQVYFIDAARVISGAQNLDELRERRTEFLGRERGAVKEALSVLPDLPLEL